MGTATPHDTLFHFTFRHPRHAAAWFRTVMPEALVAAIDWGTLRAAPEKVHGHTLRLLITDTLFEVDLLGSGHSLFVVPEHKSYVDAETQHQTLGYCVHVAHSTRTARTPPALVVPILLCHGTTAWPVTPAPHPHLEGLDPAAAAVLEALQAGLRLLIDDLMRYTEPELRRAVMTALGQLTFLCLRFLRHWTAAEALAGLERWSDLLCAVDRDEGPPLGREAIATIGWYCLHVSKIPADQLHSTFERILQRPEETIMSTAEALKREGRAETILRQMTKRFGPLPPETKERVRSATLPELERWTDRILEAKTLAEVFAS